MKAKEFIQIRLEEVFTPFFRYEKKIREGGEVFYEEVDRTPRRSGILAFDAVLRCLEGGYGTVVGIALEMGVGERDLRGLIHLVTGMNAATFISTYQLVRVSQLMRYTDMGAKEIGDYCHLGTAANVAQRVQHAYGRTFDEHRRAIRQPHDLGRFVLRMPGEK